MAEAACSDDEFIRLFQTVGPTETARHLGIGERRVYKRRRNIEKELGIDLRVPYVKATVENVPGHPDYIPMTLKNGVVLVGSDAHYWPNYISTAHRAFVEACKKLKPQAVIMNGDVVDGASISRHARIGWESSPSFKQELEAASERLGEIQEAAKNAHLFWTLGNHDARFETKLANAVPEVEGIGGMHLKDHFPYWSPCYRVSINETVEVKHRYKGGVHATHNNTVTSGRSMVTGHLHSLKVTPYSDYNGTRYGVDTGTLACHDWPQFRDYTESNPLNWRSGFAVLTFHEGRLMQPELVQVWNEEEGLVEFRGEVHAV